MNIQMAAPLLQSQVADAPGAGMTNIRQAAIRILAIVFDKRI